VVLDWAMNFQVSIDGGPQTQFQFNGVCTSCAKTFNFSVYDNQSLLPGSHTLSLTLLNATGTNRFPSIGDDTNLTVFYFDYAVINGTNSMAQTPTTSTTPPATSTVQQ
jgi:hypothetical protein